MKKRYNLYWLLVICSMASVVQSFGLENSVESDQWVEISESDVIDVEQKPKDLLRLDQWTYLCTHNAFSSKAHNCGPYRQQTLSMVDQLNTGVRALMLDTWMANKSVRLTHGPPMLDKVLRGVLGRNPRLWFQKGMHFLTELKALKEGFFDKNPDEVVFIFLENHVDDHGALDKAFQDSGLAEKILEPIEWDPNEKGGWPTFKWMRDHEKQIVVFGEGHTEPTEFIYPLWEHVYENQFGVITDQEAAQQRKDSQAYDKKGRSLFLFNFFKDYAQTLFSKKSLKRGVRGVVKALRELDFSRINSTGVRSAIEYSISKGPQVIRNRYPNFIALDFVEKGNPLGVVEEINEKASKNPEVFYRELEQ